MLQDDARLWPARSHLTARFNNVARCCLVRLAVIFIRQQDNGGSWRGLLAVCLHRDKTTEVTDCEPSEF